MTLGGYGHHHTISGEAHVDAPHAHHHPRHDHCARNRSRRRGKGEVSAVGDGSVGSTITVAVKGPKVATCKRDATSPVTTGFPVGTKV